MTDPGRQTGLHGKIFRYGISAVGPIASAGSQLLLSLMLLKMLPPDAFGSFSFLFVASVFSWGLWSALFCAPLPILMSQGTAEDREAAPQCILAVSLVASVLALAVLFGLGLLLKVPPLAAFLFAAYGAVALIRWLARAYGYASGHPLRTTASDVTYSVALVAGVGLVMLTGHPSLDLAYAALLLAAALGLLPFGRAYLAKQFLHPRVRDAAGYAAIWRQHSGWSLLGVLTTEATANAHAYIVTGLQGPSAFAPLAASALMIRPIGVATNALSEFERAQMARQIGERRFAAAIGSVRTFRLALIAVWVATAIAIGLLLAFDPRLIFPAHYPLHFLAVGALLWLAVAGMRLIRAPESALLQAAGQFRPLAYASVLSAVVSIATVVLLLVTVGPLWSIGGIFLGEAVFACWTWVQAHRWRQAQGDGAPTLNHPREVVL
ncbi:hypothetical protein [Sphingomonas sp. ID0503]|uniref:hypothetical protein n=1 Tax=Sphingomonas sp. ID0503 TaxID=3399691 RepID=UPI003AFAD2A2